MKILMITSEIAPYAKAGGLGDVVGALSRELSYRGHDIRVLCPFYGFIEPRDDWIMREKLLKVKIGGTEEERCAVWECRPWENGGYLYFLGNDKYFSGNRIYNDRAEDGHQKNGERFIFLSRAGIELCTYLDWIPDVIHCHDWMTGLVPVYLKTTEKDTQMGSVPVVLTIHNMEHQGIFNKKMLEFAGLSEELYVPEALEYMESINMLKGGLIYATKLTTVSERYAWEIIETEMGCGLNSICKERRNDLTGILNGIDVTEWNPEKDPYLPTNFSYSDVSGKKECKQHLQKYFDLNEDPEAILFGAIARLYPQKGLDLLAEIIPMLMKRRSLQVIILGTGDHNLEETFKNLSVKYKDQMGVSLVYNAELAHLIEAGLDFFLMPSRFEPCGLNQMYSMVYGAVPIVRETGGLVDTVVPYMDGIKNATGIVFEEISTIALYDSIQRACNIFYDKPDDYKCMQANGMKMDFSWGKSVLKYEEVYKNAIAQCHFLKKNI